MVDSHTWSQKRLHPGSHGLTPFILYTTPWSRHVRITKFHSWNPGWIRILTHVKNFPCCLTPWLKLPRRHRHTMETRVKLKIEQTFFNLCSKCFEILTTLWWISFYILYSFIKFLKSSATQIKIVVKTRNNVYFYFCNYEILCIGQLLLIM